MLLKLNFPLKLDIFLTDAPPGEFRVFARGKNETVKGDIVLSDRSIASIQAKEKDSGRDLVPFDYGHAQVGFVQGHEQARAAGWAKLDFRDDGLWVKDISWTPTAHKALSSREYRYFSPAIEIDTKTREVLSVTNIALTNLPATKNQAPLVASQTRHHNEPLASENTSMDEKTLVKLFVALGITEAGDVLGKVVALAQEREQLLEAVKETQLKLSVAEAKTVEYNKSQSESAKAVLITKLSEEGRLPPSLREWALSQTLESIKSFSEVAPVSGVVATPTVQAPTAGSQPVVLTDDEQKAIEMLDISADEYLKTKESLSAQPFFFRTTPLAKEAV